MNTKIKALVVDDFDTIRRIVRNVLRGLEVDDVAEARTGKHALAILMKEKIDLIISDWNMPEMTGIELLKFVRSHPNLSHIPFVMLTAEQERESIVDAVRCGVTQYVVKPFDSKTLADKIRSVLTEP